MPRRDHLSQLGDVHDQQLKRIARLQDPRFMQAVVAAGIVWLMLVVIELIGLPWIIGLGLSALATFAGLKISYGASVPRTLALFFVSGAIALVATFGANAILH